MLLKVWDLSVTIKPSLPLPPPPIFHARGWVYVGTGGKGAGSCMDSLVSLCNVYFIMFMCICCFVFLFQYVVVVLLCNVCLRVRHNALFSIDGRYVWWLSTHARCCSCTCTTHLSAHPGCLLWSVVPRCMPLRFHWGSWFSATIIYYIFTSCVI